jgi:flagellar biosynthesis/type III secretory pathway protein FliH
MRGTFVSGRGACAMSRIIKSSNATGQSGVRELTDPGGSAISVVSITKHDEERHGLLLRIAQLEDDLKRQKAETVNLNSEIERAREEGREQGYESGVIAAEDRQFERLGLLKKSMLLASDSVSLHLQSVGRLAPLLAQECLDIILGDAADRADLVARIVENQVSKLDAAMLVSIKLSRLDFPDDAALVQLAEQVGTNVAVMACDDVAPGGCVMTLKLGQMDVGLDQQWPVLRAALSEMAMPEVGE